MFDQSFEMALKYEKVTHALNKTQTLHFDAADNTATA